MPERCDVYGGETNGRCKIKDWETLANVEGSNRFNQSTDLIFSRIMGRMGSWFWWTNQLTSGYKYQFLI